MSTSHRQTRSSVELVVILSALLITVPLLAIALGIVSIVFHYQVSQTPSLFDANSRIDDSAYYVNFSATQLTTLSSWLSSLAPSLPSASMALLALPCAAALAGNTRNLHLESLPTPGQLSVLVPLLDGSWTGIWGWFSLRSQRQIPWIHMLAAVFCVGSLLR